MKKFLAVLLSIAMMLTMLCISASALTLVEENGITYAENVTRAESGFDEQTPPKCAYFCANGIPITISDRTDGVKGALISWNYNGVDYQKEISYYGIVVGGSWDSPVASTSITMNGGTIYYGIFGGGVTENATVGTAENPGSTTIVINGGTLNDGIVGGGINGDVYGNTYITVTGDSTVAQNVMGGGFYSDVYGNTDVKLLGGKFGQGYTQTFIAAGGVTGDVYGTTSMVIDGANVNGSVGGGSMISGNVYGNTEVTMSSGTVMDLIGAGIGFYSSYYGPSTVEGDTTVTLNGGTVKDIVAGGALGTSAACDVVGNTTVIINDGEIGGTSAGHTRNVYGGCVQGDVDGSTSVIINGGAMVNEVVGGAAIGDVTGTTSILINDGTIGEGVVGGSESGNIAGGAAVTVKGGEVTTGGIIGGSEEGDVGSDILIDINGGVVMGDIVGGARNGNVAGNVNIGVTGGSVEGNVVVGSLESGKIATNEDSKIVVAIEQDSHSGSVTVPESNPEDVDFDPEEDVVPVEKGTFGDWETIIEPTCTQEGLEQRHYVDALNITTETRAIPALGHTFGEWIVTTETTLSENGEKTRYCSVCGATETQVIPCNGNEPSGVTGTCKCHTEQGFLGLFYKIYFAICKVFKINKICAFCGGTHY